MASGAQGINEWSDFQYDIRWQVCSIEMRVESGDISSVTLLPFNVTMEQSPDMTLFTVTNYVLVHASGPQGGIRMTITLKRKIMSEMMTTYFPSLLLMMITYATTFFKPFFFEAALSVNLTTMLVMTTIFISKMEGLPPTSATKMIDYWLILCQLVPFVQVVLITAKEHIKDEKQEEYMGVSVLTKDNQEVKKAAWKVTPTVLSLIGKFLHILLFPNKNLFSEKKVMPMIVLSASVLYFVIAAMFFSE